MDKITININLSKLYNTYEGMGASGAWWSQAVGKWTSVTEEGSLTKDEIARLLFSKKDGIGLNCYRYNLGAGTTHPGTCNIDDVYRRAESFLDTDGNYDFSADSAAVYMMKKAVSEGADEIVLFVNSPPVSLTKNGMGHADKHKIARCNLPEKNVGAFVKYTLDVAEHFIETGLPVKYISPVNEPLWIWNGGQEGCHYKPFAAGRVMEAFAEEMNRRPALASVKLSGMENGDIRWFNRSYTAALMRYSAVRERVDSVDIHSYFLRPFFPFNNRQGYLRRFNRFVSRRYPGLKIKMSEWCHMQGGRDSGMTSALVTANTIYEDLAVLGAVSWQHWIACSCYDYCDGLIYIDMKNENFELTKRYYVTGNFSRFIPKGARRAELTTDSGSVRGVAYTKEGNTVAVLINNGETGTSVSFKNSCKAFLTDKEHNLSETSYPPGGSIELPPFSVTTVCGV